MPRLLQVYQPFWQLKIDIVIGTDTVMGIVTAMVTGTDTGITDVIAITTRMMKNGMKMQENTVGGFINIVKEVEWSP